MTKQKEKHGEFAKLRETALLIANSIGMCGHASVNYEHLTKDTIEIGLFFGFLWSGSDAADAIDWAACLGEAQNEVGDALFSGVYGSCAISIKPDLERTTNAPEELDASGHPISVIRQDNYGVVRDGTLQTKAGKESEGFLLETLSRNVTGALNSIGLGAPINGIWLRLGWNAWHIVPDKEMRLVYDRKAGKK